MAGNVYAAFWAAAPKRDEPAFPDYVEAWVADLAASGKILEHVYGGFLPDYGVLPQEPDDLSKTRPARLGRFLCRLAHRTAHGAVRLWVLSSRYRKGQPKRRRASFFMRCLRRESAGTVLDAVHNRGAFSGEASIDLHRTHLGDRGLGMLLCGAQFWKGSALALDIVRPLCRDRPGIRLIWGHFKAFVAGVRAAHFGGDAAAGADGLAWFRDTFARTPCAVAMVDRAIVRGGTK